VKTLTHKPLKELRHRGCRRSAELLSANVGDLDDDWKWNRPFEFSEEPFDHIGVTIAVHCGVTLLRAPNSSEANAPV